MLKSLLDPSAEINSQAHTPRLAAMAEKYERLDSFQFLDLIPVKKYRSKRTGINFCFAQVQGPLVNGFLCLGKKQFFLELLTAECKKLGNVAWHGNNPNL